MEILPMLARLENALGYSAMTKQMVLIPKSRSACLAPSEDINLVVGYNGSPCSQTALDLTLWIAHQTRLATCKSVTVQVVYVIDSADFSPASPSSPCENQALGSTLASLEAAVNLSNQAEIHPLEKLPEAIEPVVCSQLSGRSNGGCLVAEPPERTQTGYRSPNWQIQQFERADRILWQARQLANEWRGSLKTHLRIGSVAEELRAVAEAEKATVLLLGCCSADHSIVRSLVTATPCPVLGIPHAS